MRIQNVGAKCALWSTGFNGALGGMGRLRSRAGYSGGGWKGGWALSYVFSNISEFPKIAPNKSFGNSWNSSSVKFAIIDNKFRFTCGESDQYWNFVKSRNIMTRIKGAFSENSVIQESAWNNTKRIGEVKIHKSRGKGE